jgi:hypothetical protein
MLAAEHVAHEPRALSGSQVLAGDAAAAALSEWGLGARAWLGRWLYVDHCSMPNGRGLHAVFETAELGKVTLILPPQGSRVAAAQARYGDFNASTFSVSGTAMAIISDDPGRTARAQQWVEQRLVRL